MPHRKFIWLSSFSTVPVHFIHMRGPQFQNWSEGTWNEYALSLPLSCLFLETRKWKDILVLISLDCTSHVLSSYSSQRAKIQFIRNIHFWGYLKNHNSIIKKTLNLFPSWLWLYFLMKAPRSDIVCTLYFLWKYKWMESKLKEIYDN